LTPRANKNARQSNDTKSPVKFPMPQIDSMNQTSNEFAIYFSKNSNSNVPGLEISKVPGSPPDERISSGSSNPKEIQALMLL